MRRRALLALLGTGATAGCSAVSGVFGREQYAGLASIGVLNHYDESRTVTVQVEADGDVVTDHAFELDGSGDVLDSGSVPCGWRGTDGPYVVRARHETSAEWATLALDDVAESSQSVRVLVWVGDNSLPGDEVALWFSTNPNVEDCRAGATATGHTPKENAF